MTVSAALPLIHPRPDRTGRDRLELLTALINSPSFDPAFREDIIRIPPQHPAYPWHCVVPDCERPRWQKTDLCANHTAQWRQAHADGIGRTAFIRSAQPLALNESLEPIVCRICRHRPAFNRELALCHRHRNRWRAYHHKYGEAADFQQWLSKQIPCHSYGECCVPACPDLAGSPLGLCVLHQGRYYNKARPGGARLPKGWFAYEHHGLAVPVFYDDQAAFRRWCDSQLPIMRIGEINLRALKPLLQAEIRWGLHAHAQHSKTPWELPWIQGFVDLCHQRGLTSLVDLDPEDCGSYHRRIAREMLEQLRLVYYTPEDTKQAGFLETEHFGIRFPSRSSHIDLTGISQRWLRDLAWDYMANLLRSPKCTRTGMPLDSVRRACVELSAFLETAAPAGGHDPTELRAEHMHRFVADLRHRETHGLACLAITRTDGRPTIMTESVRHVILNYGRRFLRDALETYESDRIGLDRRFITAIPQSGTHTKRSRAPFTDEVARALADEANLRQLATVYDPYDRGVRDVWEAIVLTGRRASEILNLRWDCIGRYNGLPLLWHDQTKVGNYNEAIRIPERLYEILATRQRKTLTWFADTHGGRQPTAAERSALALFVSNQRNRDGTRAISYTWFHTCFKQWVDQLDLGNVVTHQARHTMATRLLRHGATLTHIRRYLGQVSDRMAEHYVKVAVSEIEDILQHVWVAGPGAAEPGKLLSTAVEPMNRLDAEALAMDLSRRSTPAQGGFCTFQPVIDGGACPWNLDCENCDKFVLSGADLLYWRRKREQWRSIAERAPDEATADYLHQVFEPTARAIDGLEKALAGLGLLDDALALDLRRPQDYFHRLWNLGFRARDLANAAEDDPPQELPA